MATTKNHPALLPQIIVLVFLLAGAGSLYAFNNKSSLQPPKVDVITLDAQQDSIFNYNLELFFRDYYQYGRLSENRRTISSYYTDKYRELFDKNAMIFDFLISDKLLTLDEYLDNLISEFSHGISFIEITRQDYDIYEFRADSHLASVLVKKTITVHYAQDNYTAVTLSEELVFNIIIGKTLDRGTFSIESIRRPVIFPIPEVRVRLTNLASPTQRIADIELVLLDEGQIIQTQKSNVNGVVSFLSVPSDRPTVVRLADGAPYDGYEDLDLDPLASSFDPNEVFSYFLTPAEVVSEPAKLAQEAAEAVQETAEVVQEAAEVVQEPAEVAQEPEEVVISEPEERIQEPTRERRVQTPRSRSALTGQTWLLGASFDPFINSFNLVDYHLGKPYTMPGVRSLSLGYAFGFEVRNRRYVFDDSFIMDLGFGLGFNSFSYSYSANQITYSVPNHQLSFSNFVHEGDLLLLQLPLSVHLRHEKAWSAFDARWFYLKLTGSIALRKHYDQTAKKPNGDPADRTDDINMTGMLPILQFGAGFDINTNIPQLVFEAGLGCSFLLGNLANNDESNASMNTASPYRIFDYATSSRLFQIGPTFRLIYRIEN